METKLYYFLVVVCVITECSSFPSFGTINSMTLTAFTMSNHYRHNLQCFSHCCDNMGRRNSSGGRTYFDGLKVRFLMEERSWQLRRLAHESRVPKAAYTSGDQEADGDRGEAGLITLTAHLLNFFHPLKSVHNLFKRFYQMGPSV